MKVECKLNIFNVEVFNINIELYNCSEGMFIKKFYFY